MPLNCRCMRTHCRTTCLLIAYLWNMTAADGQSSSPPSGGLRIATFNVSLNRSATGQLGDDLAASDPQAIKVAAVLRRVRPDIVLLNEFDYDPTGETVRKFQQEYLRTESSEAFPFAPLIYEHVLTAPVNTGEPSGLDLNRDGAADGPNDAFGYGRFPGQYGMVLLSRYPIQRGSARTFRKLLWKEMPHAAAPVDPHTGTPWFPDDVWKKLRLSSKSHWDVPIQVGEFPLHILACHPTPPAFDGPEDRNGKRNHDEIRFWADYLSPKTSGWIVDDQGRSGGLKKDAAFVILGDMNADPVDGGSHNHAIRNLLNHPRVNAGVVPKSEGAAEAATVQQAANGRQRGTSAYDTADFSDRTVGNLRVDYVLPATGMPVAAGGVFWPKQGQPHSEDAMCSDHHLVWIDVILPPDQHLDKTQP